jgi:signal peptidase II
MATSKHRDASPLHFGVAAAVAAAVADQAVKLWLLFGYDLPERGRLVLAPFLDIVLAWNTGISYGLFREAGQAAQWVLFAATLAVIALLSAWLTRTGSRLSGIALGLIIGGAIGNVIDRAVHGAVMDFVLFHITAATWTFQWYAFNVADAAIVAGVAGLLYESLFAHHAVKAP